MLQPLLVLAAGLAGLAAGQTVEVLDLRSAAIQLLLSNSSSAASPPVLNLLAKFGAKTQE